ncbi:MAG: type II CRISPR-associated endonuclease Cas1 [Paludibacteraceae bacterium]|nr:type II CRISPR-associated endonuclease Cas1 [Paludibacteraceae bacterium]
MIKRVLCFENPARLSLKLEQIVVELQDTTRTVPIEDVGVVILDHKQITITHALIDALLANNCAIVTSNDKHLPVGLMLPLDGHNLQSERFREQIEASEPLKKQMWQQTVIAKILGQAHVLGAQHIEHGNMMAWAKIVRSGDTDNMEARAAAYYWRTVFKNDEFIRDPQGMPPNNLLNYGYSIVRAMMARALVGAGLLPTLGIHHHSRYDAYCLADDIMEPYRPFVDMKVLEIWSKGGVTSDISSDQKRELLGITTMDVNISGHRSPMMLAIQVTAQSVQKCFSGTARKIIYPDW